MSDREHSSWRLIHRCLIPDAPLSRNIAPDEATVRSLLRRRGVWMCRWTDRFDRAADGEGWYVVKDTADGWEALSASTRSKVRRALRRCSYVRTTDEKTLVDRWTVTARDTGKTIGFAECRLFAGTEVFYDRFGASRDSLRGYYPLYGLIWEMNRYYLGERGMRFAFDGFRTMRERSGIQEFLIRKFGFRRAYCEVHLR